MHEYLYSTYSFHHDCGIAVGIDMTIPRLLSLFLVYSYECLIDNIIILPLHRETYVIASRGYTTNQFSGTNTGLAF